jgi:hypothetical protein
MGTLWYWQTEDPGNGKQQLVAGVSPVPLQKGQWFDHYWGDAQTSRCSNNCPMPFWGFWNTLPYALEWHLTTDEDAANITFSVAADEPGSDLTLWTGQSHKSIAGVAPWSPSLQARGLYICNVRGATKPFSIVATPR